MRWGTLIEWPCHWSGPIGHFARNSSCSTFRLLHIYFLPSKILSWLSLLTVNHTDSLSWKPMLNFMFQKSPRMGRPQKKKRSRKWVSLRLPPRESKWTCVITPSLRSFQSIGRHRRHLILCWLLQVSFLLFFFFGKDCWFHVSCFQWSPRLKNLLNAILFQNLLSVWFCYP